MNRSNSMAVRVSIAPSIFLVISQLYCKRLIRAEAIRIVIYLGKNKSTAKFTGLDRPVFHMGISMTKKYLIKRRNKGDA